MNVVARQSPRVSWRLLRFARNDTNRDCFARHSMPPSLLMTQCRLVISSFDDASGVIGESRNDNRPPLSLRGRRSRTKQSPSQSTNRDCFARPAFHAAFARNDRSVRHSMPQSPSHIAVISSFDDASGGIGEFRNDRQTSVTNAQALSLLPS